MKNQTMRRSSAAKGLSLGLIFTTLLFSYCKKEEKSAAEQQNDSSKNSATVSLTKSPTSGYLYGHGVNIQPSYYNNGNVNFGWSLMRSYTKIKTLRIEVEPNRVTQAKSWIQQANAMGTALSLLITKLVH